MRATPFTYVFADIAARFPAIAEALQQEGIDPVERDRFVLLEPVGRLLRDIVPDDAGADALEAHVLLLHHAFLFWAAGERVYPISDVTLREAVSGKQITTHTPATAQYLQLPELRVWGASNEANPREPLDGMFVSRTAAPGEVAVLAIFGMRPDRPGFSAVGLEGRADPDDPRFDEIAIAPFGPKDLYAVANAGELLVLTARLLALLDSGLPHEHESHGGQGRRT